MKFAEQLASHITPEWRKQYIQYEEMKSILYAAVERAPSPEVVDQSLITRYTASFEEEFFLRCEKELTKINTFFSEKIAEATRKSGSLKSELHNLLTGDNDEKRWGRMQEKPGLRLRALKRHHTNARLQTRKIHELRLAFSEFYLSVILLQNYQDLNFTGFRKILKKHDKLIKTDAGAKWRIAYVEVAPFYLNKDIDKLILDTERIVTKELEGGDRQKAMKRLRVPPLNDQQSPWVTFKVGLFSGAFTVLMGAVAISGIFHVPEDWNVPIRLYRGSLLVIMFMFLMGVNVYGWRTSGVNHVLIFEIDPRNHLSEQHLMEMAGILGVLWSLSVLAFLYSDALSIPPYASPLSLIVIMLLFLFNPTKTMRHQARFWLLKYLGRVAGSPFFYVGFADFWLADQLNSLVPVLVDFQYILCFYSTLQDWSVHQSPNHCMEGVVSKTIRPIIACLPAWFRFSQCLRRYRDSKEAFPHLVNAGKYSTTFFNVAFSTMYAVTRDSYGVNWSNPFFYLWIAFAIISSLYTYIWDIKMDWGLFDSSTGDNKFLREEIVYSSPNFYYFAVLEDFFLRFGWTLTISLTELGMTNTEILATIFAPLEVFRRFIWNFFRLENEHLNNCGQFRAVRDISVAPLDSSDQALLLVMMDEEDGVSNRKMKEGKIVRRKKSETRISLEGDDVDDDPYI